MNEAVAFFDTCSRHPDDGNTEFVIAEKMGHVSSAVEQLLQLAQVIDAPVLSTSCLGLQRTNPHRSLGGTCAATCSIERSSDARVGFLGMNATQEEIQHALSCRQIMIERTSCKSGEENLRRRTFDPFNNPHTQTLVHSVSATGSCSAAASTTVCSP